MPGYQHIKCAQCGMAFPNDEALGKHKTRFCVGVKDSGIGRKQYYDDEYPTRHRGNNQPTHRPSSRKGPKIKHRLIRPFTGWLSERETQPKKGDGSIKRNEVQDWKHKRSMLQNLKDMEDQAFYNTQRARKPAAKARRPNGDYDHMLSEFERLEAQERDILRQMSLIEDPHGPHSYSSNGLSNHERHQLDALKRENGRLEHERRRNFQPNFDDPSNNDQLTGVPNYEPHKLLRDMQQQRDYSQRNLHLLTDPLGRRAFSTEVPSLPYLPVQRRTSDDDLRNMRNTYLQSGGHNAAVLANYSDMERRLTRYDHYSSMNDRPEPLRRQKYHAVPAFPGVDMTSTKLSVVKNDNQRLQNELDEIRRRFQGLDSRTRQLESGSVPTRVPDPMPSEEQSYPITRVNGHPPMNSLIHSSNRQNEHIQRGYRSYSPTYDRQVAPSNPFPYDPVDGFVIFFDFIANLSPSIDRVRLITCLHHEQTGLGEPSQLDACRCELAVDELSNDTMRTAYVATKQPVPRCPAQQALKIIVEVQTTLRQAPNESFQTAAWTKMPVFEYGNRLLTGRWKVPLKALPIQHDERVSVIGLLPTFGNAELYYRLVNLRDAADQSNTTFVPKSRDLYRTPPQ